MASTCPTESTRNIERRPGRSACSSASASSSARWITWLAISSTGTPWRAPTAAWNIAEGEHISAQDYLDAEESRARLYRSFEAFFRDFDLLIAPAASVLPWPNEISDVLSIDGRDLTTIVDYLAVTFIVSLVGFPVLSLPAPQGSHRLPFGIQIIARPGAEALLSLAQQRLHNDEERGAWIIGGGRRGTV